MPDAAALHRSAIVIDAVCPLLNHDRHIDTYRAGGCTAVAPSVGAFFGAAETLKSIGRWYRLIRTREDLLLVRSTADIRRAKAENKLGIIMHFQGTEPIEQSLDAIDAFKALGVGIMQLAYNTKNRVGDGAEERTDAGLSRFGVAVVKRMNEARVIVDCAHTGYRTTMDAIEASTAPVVISHANPKGVLDCRRNIRDDQIKAIAATGGLIGVVGYPAFVAATPRPTLDQFVDHIDYLMQTAGPAHVGLGLDYTTLQHPYMPLDQAEAAYRGFLSEGTWTAESYPPPPWHYPAGIETPDTLHNLTKCLVRRGYTEQHARGVLGENWMRVYDAVWGG